MAAKKAPSGTARVPVTRSGWQPSTIGTPRLRATSARCEPAAPVRAMTPRAANSSGARAGTGWSTSRIASPQSSPGRSCGRTATSRPAAVPGAPGRPGTCSPRAWPARVGQHGGREQRHRRTRGGQLGRPAPRPWRVHRADSSPTARPATGPGPAPPAAAPARCRPPPCRGQPAHRGGRFRGGPADRGTRALGLQQPDPVVIGGPLDHVVAQQPPGPAGQSRHCGDHRPADQRGQPVVTGLVPRPRATSRGRPIARGGKRHPAPAGSGAAP